MQHLCRTVKLANVSTGAHVPCLLARTLDENCKCQWANAHAGYRRFWISLWKTTDCSTMRDTEAYRRKKGNSLNAFATQHEKNVYIIRRFTTHWYGVVAWEFRGNAFKARRPHGMPCTIKISIFILLPLLLSSFRSIAAIAIPANALRSRTKCIVRTTNHMTNETFMIMYQLPATFRRTEVNGESNNDNNGRKNLVKSRKLLPCLVHNELSVLSIIYEIPVFRRRKLFQKKIRCSLSCDSTIK